MASAGDAEPVDLAVADPVRVGVDEAGVRDVVADVDDRHLVTGERQDLVPRPDSRDHPVVDEDGLGDRRLRPWSRSGRR